MVNFYSLGTLYQLDYWPATDYLTLYLQKMLLFVCTGVYYTLRNHRHKLFSVLNLPQWCIVTQVVSPVCHYSVSVFNLSAVQITKHSHLVLL